jgi:DNA-binding transcriptional LysR family regulator
LSPFSGKFRSLTIFWLVVWLVGCQTSSEALPNQQTLLRVELSPTLRYLSPAIQACTLQSENLHIILEEKPVIEMGKTGADVSLIWGDRRIPAGMQVYRLGSDRLVYVVHKDNPLIRLKIDQAIYLMRAGFATWGDALAAYCPDCEVPNNFGTQAIEAWHYTAGEDIYSEIIGLSAQYAASSLRRVWLAPSPENLAQAVAEHPGAVGWLPARWLNDNLKEVFLDGVDPSAQVIPVLAVTSIQPQGVRQTWLQCLQSTYGN